LHDGKESLNENLAVSSCYT